MEMVASTFSHADDPRIESGIGPSNDWMKLQQAFFVTVCFRTRFGTLTPSFPALLSPSLCAGLLWLLLLLLPLWVYALAAISKPPSISDQ